MTVPEAKGGSVITADRARGEMENRIKEQQLAPPSRVRLRHSTPRGRPRSRAGGGRVEQHSEFNYHWKHTGHGRGPGGNLGPLGSKMSPPSPRKRCARSDERKPPPDAAIRINHPQNRCSHRDQSIPVAPGEKCGLARFSHHVARRSAGEARQYKTRAAR